MLQAEGRDTRGQGNASATVIATLVEADGGTVVKIDTDLNITGKVAQFGRGVMADVSSKLLGQFADNLKKDVLTGTPSRRRRRRSPARRRRSAPPARPTPGSPSTGATDAGPRKIESKEAEPIDLMDAAGGSVGKRIVPILAVLVVVLALRSIFKRRKKRRSRRVGPPPREPPPLGSNPCSIRRLPGCLLSPRSSWASTRGCRAVATAWSGATERRSGPSPTA